tara:strand:- start:1697 stop:2491 length:795 start_codon:yes stop_codon:yes gene_type:complete
MYLFENTRTTLKLARDNIVNSSLVICSQNKETITKCLLFIIGFTVTSFITGDYTGFYYFYWFLLGVLSTVGFGFGLPTGTLFLIPHIIANYNSPGAIGTEVYWKSLPVVLSWGIGTAIGELPPYYLARYNQHEYLEYVKDYTNYMVYLKKNSFLFITVGSSWPNMTFDFVGMMCGLNNISVLNFIIPTILGKAFIKAPFQLFCVIYFYSEISPQLLSPPTYIASIVNVIFSGVILVFIYKTINTLANNELKSKLIKKKTIPIDK